MEILIILPGEQTEKNIIMKEIVGGNQEGNEGDDNEGEKRKRGGEEDER
jgi:hypothetical protein